MKVQQGCPSGSDFRWPWASVPGSSLHRGARPADIAKETPNLDWLEVKKPTRFSCKAKTLAMCSDATRLNGPHAKANGANLNWGGGSTGGDETQH